MSQGSWFKGARRRSGAGGRDEVGGDEVGGADGAGGEDRPGWAGGDGGRISHHPCLNPAPGKVIRIPRSPRRLHFAAPLLSAFRAAAGVLPTPHSVVRKKPMMTDAARTRPARWHDEPSSRRHAEHLRAYLDSKRGGLVLLSRHGSVLESAEEVASVFGLGAFGSGFGGMIFAPLTGLLIDHFSFMAAFIFFGLIPVISISIVWTVMGPLEPLTGLVQATGVPGEFSTS